MNVTFLAFNYLFKQLELHLYHCPSRFLRQRDSYVNTIITIPKMIEVINSTIQPSNTSHFLYSTDLPC